MKTDYPLAKQFRANSHTLRESAIEQAMSGFLDEAGKGCKFFCRSEALTKIHFPDSGIISSAGHIPVGCEWKESSLRELKEELGLSVAENEIKDAGLYRISADDVFHGKTFHDRQVSRIFLLFKDLPESVFTVQKEELSEVRWFDLNQTIKNVKADKMGTCLEAEELEIVRKVAEQIVSK